MESKHTPIPEMGIREADVESAGILLSTLVQVPPQANSAVMSMGNFGDVFYFRLDGQEGLRANEAMPTLKLELSNRQQIDACVLVQGSAGAVFVEFFTGRTGITE